MTVDFEVLPYPDRYQELLELRHLALTATRQLAPGTSVADLADPRDVEAALIVADVDGRLVASGRLTPPLDGPILHADNRLLGPEVGIPPRDQYLEYSKACIHPDYHGQGLFWPLVARCVKVAQSLGRPYLLGGTNPDLFRFWGRCGFEKVPTLYTGPNNPDVVYSAMVLDVEAVLAGRGVSAKLVEALDRLED